MGMLVDKNHQGFGYRGWRYAMVVGDGVVEKWFEEPGSTTPARTTTPYGATGPATVLAYLRGHQPMAAE
jgi:peroxiredoxin